MNDATSIVILPGGLVALADIEGERRINDQYRICFEWRDGNAYEVEITDYH